MGLVSALALDRIVLVEAICDSVLEPQPPERCGTELSSAVDLNQSGFELVRI